MNWDQIEIKWAEMTSRLRADVPMAVARDGATFTQGGTPASDLHSEPNSARAERAEPATILANAE